MAIKVSEVNGKKVYEVYVNGFDLRGRRVQFRRRGIESIRKAEDIQFECERKLANLREEGVPYTWKEWFDIAVSRMKLDLRASTILSYESYLGEWVNDRWKDRELKSITRQDVFDVVMDQVECDLTPHSRKTLLKCTKRVFQMALEDGLIDRNPAVGVKVHVPEVEQKVLTNEEARIFLREAKATNHRFYPVWLMALFTGMRSGELFALLWSDVDLDTRMISVNKQWTNKVGITSTKTRRSRQVPISDELLTFLKEWKLKSGTDRVLPFLKEWENGEQALVTRQFCRRVGITEVKFH